VAVRLAHSQGSALSLYFTITAIVAGGLAGLFMLAFLFPRATRRGAHVGIFACLAFTVWATLTLNGKMLDLGRFNFTWHEYMIGAIGHIILVVVGVACSYLLPDEAPTDPGLTLWGWIASRKSHQIENATATMTP